ncbi:dienelactone hydrolase family protein [Shouchella patagoniensis]|uniref:dienelactone hydrolase family protein n=1 Tax=Shouchella patagoniensis TaxID=228576 RepID=UPI0009951C0B|nr:alpha/beta hydrolase family protein [Shouchella patagoniensis]
MADVDHYLRTLYEGRPSVSMSKEKRIFALKQALGTFVPSDQSEGIRISCRQYDQYSEETFVIETTDCLRMPFRMLLPHTPAKGEPIVLALHGHGTGATEALEAGSSHRGFAKRLVKQGCIVVLPELIGFGARKKSSDEAENNSCFSIASELLLYGKTLAGLRVCETLHLVNWLNTHPQFMKSSIGVFGFSGGGLIALLLAATDERIQATVLSGFGAMIKDSVLARRHCLDNYIPGLLTIGEMPELLALIAPRPLFIESGDQDMLFPSSSVQEATKQENVMVHLFKGLHEVNGEESIPWLIKQLQERGEGNGYI